MKAESLSFGIAAIIEKEAIRQSTGIDYIHDNLEAKQNKKLKTGNPLHGVIPGPVNQNNLSTKFQMHNPVNMILQSRHW